MQLLKTALLTTLTIALFGATVHADDFEKLYQEAVGLAIQGKSAEAVAKFEQAENEGGGVERLHEDYGPQIGGFFYDRGMVLLSASEWEAAKEAFENSANATAFAKEVESPIPSVNPREAIAKYQLGFAHAMTGDFETAIGLYDQYLATSPPEEELAPNRPALKLRYGTALLKTGKKLEGLATLQELFDNRLEWQVNGSFLTQAFLELGLDWVDQGKAAQEDVDKIAEVEQKALSFLEANGQFLKLRPYEQFKGGILDRLRKMAFEAAGSNLFNFSIQLLMLTPSLEDVRLDTELFVAPRLRAGQAMPASIQSVLDKVAVREAGPGMHPDLENLRLMASCYEKLGNVYMPRVIYWHIAENYPDLETEFRGQVLHEAARLASMLGDYTGAQYFGTKFTSEMPADHPLAQNIDIFMLQSLFTNQEYETVIEIAKGVQEDYELGDPSRELADSLLPLALFSTKQYKEADPLFESYMTAYPDGGNREFVAYHRGANAMQLGDMRVAEGRLVDFIKEFPKSEAFGERALGDLVVARFNLADYNGSIEAADELSQLNAKSIYMPRSQNLKGDSFQAKAADLSDQQEEQKAEWDNAALNAFKTSIAVLPGVMSTDTANEEYYTNLLSEATYKASSISFDQGKNSEGIALYDSFFPEMEDTFYAPQMAVFSLEPLEEAGRGNQALEQVEKEIFKLGTKTENQDLTLLRQAIGSYSDASRRIKGDEATIERLDDFPQIRRDEHEALLTWLKIQQVSILQDMRKGKDPNGAEIAALNGRIDKIFKELELFDIDKLSEYALQQLGLRLAASENPFPAIPYFEELLSRNNPEADAYKAPAEVEIAKIEERSPDASKKESAKQRYRRVLEKYNNIREYRAEAHLGLARLAIGDRDWQTAVDNLDVINKDKKMFNKDRMKRAEAGYMLGNALQNLKDMEGASKAFLSVFSTGGSAYTWVIQSWDRYITLSLEDIAKRPETTEAEKLDKRNRELAVYRLTLKNLFTWQNLTDEADPSGTLRRMRRRIDDIENSLQVTPEEKEEVFRILNIPMDRTQWGKTGN